MMNEWLKMNWANTLTAITDYDLNCVSVRIYKILKSMERLLEEDFIEIVFFHGLRISTDDEMLIMDAEI